MAGYGYSLQFLWELLLRPRSKKHPPKFGGNRPGIKWQKKALEIIMANHCYHE